MESRNDRKSSALSADWAAETSRRSGFEDIVNKGIEIAEKGSGNEFEMYGVRE